MSIHRHVWVWVLLHGVRSSQVYKAGLQQTASGSFAISGSLWLVEQVDLAKLCHMLHLIGWCIYVMSRMLLSA